MNSGVLRLEGSLIRLELLGLVHQHGLFDLDTLQAVLRLLEGERGLLVGAGELGGDAGLGCKRGRNTE